MGAVLFVSLKILFPLVFAAARALIRLDSLMGEDVISQRVLVKKSSITVSLGAREGKFAQVLRQMFLVPRLGGEMSITENAFMAGRFGVRPGMFVDVGPKSVKVALTAFHDQITLQRLHIAEVALHVMSQNLGIDRHHVAVVAFERLLARMNGSMQRHSGLANGVESAGDAFQRLAFEMLVRVRLEESRVVRHEVAKRAFLQLPFGFVVML